MSKFDTVEKPQHYNSGEFEVIEIIEQGVKNISGIGAVCLANVIKYVGRAPIKNTNEDINKALWYMKYFMKKDVVVSYEPGSNLPYEDLLKQMLGSLGDTYVGYHGAQGAKEAYKVVKEVSDLLYGLATNRGVLPGSIVSKLEELEAMVIKPVKRYRGNTVALDVDNVLTTLGGTLNMIGAFIGVDQLPESIPDFDLRTAYPGKEAEVQEYWEKSHQEYVNNSILNPLYHDVIVPKFTKGSRVVVITSRPKELNELTAEWLDRNGIEYSVLVSTGGGSKIDVLDELGVKYIIDDNPGLVQELEDRGRKDIRVGLVGYEFNESKRYSPVVNEYIEYEGNTKEKGWG